MPAQVATQKKSKKKPSQTSRKKPGNKGVVLSKKVDGLMQEFLNNVTEAAYLVAVKTGFRGTFINFLAELQESLNMILKREGALRVTKH